MIDALYTRVSTDKQEHASQLREVRSWCKAQRIQPVEFSDTASGTKFNRTGLDGVMAKVRSGKVRSLIVWKLDRLGRSLSGAVRLIEELNKHKTALVCTSQNIDTRDQNSASRFQLHVLMAVAQFERDIISERTKAGLAVVRARGVRLGRPPGPDVRQQVVAMRKKGFTYYQIAQKLGVAVGKVWSVANL